MFPQELQIPHIKQITEIRSFPDSPVVFKTFYNYDRSGHLVEVVFEKYDEEGHLCDTARNSYRFYPEKNTLESQQFTREGLLRGTEKIQYDARGRKMKSTSYDASGEEFYRTEFTYDELGRLIEVGRFPNSDENSSTIYSYNAGGQLISDETRAFGHLIEGDTISGSSSYSYNSKGQLTVLIAHEPPFENKGKESTYEYNAKGNIAKIQFYRFEGAKSELEDTNEYTYLFY